MVGAKLINVEYYRFSGHSKRSASNRTRRISYRSLERFIGGKSNAKCHRISRNIRTGNIFCFPVPVSLIGKKRSAGYTNRESFFVSADDCECIQHFGSRDEFDSDGHLFGRVDHGSQLCAKCCGYIQRHHSFHSYNSRFAVHRLVKSKLPILLFAFSTFY